MKSLEYYTRMLMIFIATRDHKEIRDATHSRWGTLWNIVPSSWFITKTMRKAHQNSETEYKPEQNLIRQHNYCC